MVTDVKTEYAHIVRRSGAAGDRAVIAGTNLAVWFIIRQLRSGDKPEIIVKSYGYPTLTLASIHDAVNYYHDHRSEIDTIIEHGDREAAKHSKPDVTRR